jgi:hypothetical protein
VKKKSKDLKPTNLRPSRLTYVRRIRVQVQQVQVQFDETTKISSNLAEV